MISLLIAASALTLKLLTPICLAPCEMFVDVRVVSDEANRKVTLVVDNGADFYRSSELNVAPTERDGKLVYPPQVVRIRYPSLPPGEYVVKATLIRNDGVGGVVWVNAVVKGFDGDEN